MRNNSVYTLEIKQIVSYIPKNCEDMLESDDMRNIIKEFIKVIEENATWYPLKRLFPLG